MTTFIAATTLSTNSVSTPSEYETLEREVTEHIRRTCNHVTWQANYALMGPFDYIDVFDAPDMDEAMKVAAILRSRGHAQVQVWPARGWKRFKALMKELKTD